MASVRRYDASSISVQSDAEGVRSNPGMYLGDVDHHASLQAFVEILQNAVDETRECGGGVIRVSIRKTSDYHYEVIVADQGRGIPVERHRKTGKSALETVMTKLHAGGKSSGKTAYGKRTIGVHGVGASVVCALSTTLDAWSHRDGKWHHAKFVRGVREKSEEHPTPFSWPRGTIVRYVLDESVLTQPLQLRAARQRAALTTCWDPVTIQWSDPEKRAVLRPSSPSRLMRLVVERSKSTLLTKPVAVDANGVRAVVAWCTNEASRITASVAGSIVPGGTHVQGLEQAAREALVAASRDKTLDGTVGLIAVIDVSVDRPSFGGQNKTTLRTSETRRRVHAALLRPLVRGLRGDRSRLQLLADHVRDITKINQHADERKQLSRSAKEGKATRTSLPLGFKSATTFPPHQRELFILEGKSALGIGMQAKMPWQEILPIRGKLPNLVKRSSLLKNEVVSNIIAATGYDPQRPDRPLRVGKIVLLCDADDDGCADGDARVLTPDLSNPTLRELTDAWDGTPFPVTCRDFTGNVVTADAFFPRITRTVREMTRVSLTGISPVLVTEDHEWCPLEPCEHSTVRDGLLRVQARHLQCGRKLVGINPTFEAVPPRRSSVDYDHYVVSHVRTVEQTTDVYCITVPEYGNYFFAAEPGSRRAVSTSNSHIEVLLLTVLHRVMPEVIERGMLRVVVSPLFEAMDSRGNQVTGNDLAVMQRQYGKLKNVNRMKGWGGCEAPLLNEVAFDPATRKWITIGRPSDREKVAFERLMGPDTAARKALLSSASEARSS